MKITVITVAYNSGTTIADTIRSVAAQNYVDYEHLVVDGLSTDGTIEVVENLRHPRLILSSEPDRGIYDAMNKGLDRASGEVIGFLNADDLYADKDVLTRVALAFEDPEVEACFADLVYVKPDNSTVVRFWKSKPYSKGCFATGWSPAHPTFYIRSSALDRWGQFDLTYRLAADTEFMMRYLEVGQIKSAYIPHVQVRMRVGGATNQSWHNIAQQNREIFHALENNRISYSAWSFWAHKLACRLWQRLASLCYRFPDPQRCEEHP